MLEVSLPEHIIKLFKLTCRNYHYGFSFNTNVYSVSEDLVPNINQGGPYLRCTQEYVRGVRNGLYIGFMRDGKVDKIIVFKNGFGSEKYCLQKIQNYTVANMARVLMKSLLKKHMLNKENNKNEKDI